MTVRWNLTALDELERQVRYVRAHDPVAAARLAAAVFEATSRLDGGLLEGPLTPIPSHRDARSWRVHPLRLFYTREGPVLVILHIRHHRRGDLPQ